MIAYCLSVAEEEGEPSADEWFPSLRLALDRRAEVVAREDPSLGDFAVERVRIADLPKARLVFAILNGSGYVAERTEVVPGWKPDEAPIVHLALVVAEWADEQHREARVPTNAWLKAREGKVYVRYAPLHNFGSDRLTVATLDVKKRFRRQGVATRILAVAGATRVSEVGVENVLVPEWGARLAATTLPDRTTRVDLDTFGRGVHSYWFNRAPKA